MKSKKDLLHYDSGSVNVGEKISAFLRLDGPHLKMMAGETNDSAWEVRCRSSRVNRLIKVGSLQCTNTYILYSSSTDNFY